MGNNYSSDLTGRIHWMKLEGFTAVDISEEIFDFCYKRLEGLYEAGVSVNYGAGFYHAIVEAVRTDNIEWEDDEELCCKLYNSFITCMKEENCYDSDYIDKDDYKKGFYAGVIYFIEGLKWIY
ncbi:MAG: hypothetical protein K0S61_2559 [Anaerocolumna sp.]|nr:hypothetical protein [Anaerocolumna sp.]